MGKIMYSIVCETGIIGIKYYKTFEEAETAAKIRTNLSGKKWMVKAVILR